MPDGVIFDMDGVLVASDNAHAASWKMAARKHGVEITDEQFKATFGRPSLEIIRLLWGCDELTDDQVLAIDDEKETVYRDLIRGMVPLTIGAKEALHALCGAAYVLAVATSAPPENLDLVLDEKDLRSFFAATVTRADITRGKPAPDCFLLAAERIGVEPTRCVVVEDAPVGIEAARAAGMKVIGLIGTHPRETLEAVEPTHIIDSLGAITPDLIATLLAS